MGKRENIVRMASGRDEVQESVYSAVSETRVTFNSGLLCQDIIVLAFKVGDNLLESASRKEVNQPGNDHMR